MQKKTEDFMRSNLGFLTGTYVGAGSNAVTNTQVARKQVGDLADPKAVPRRKKIFRSQANLSSADHAARNQSQSVMPSKRPSLSNGNLNLVR